MPVLLGKNMRIVALSPIVHETFKDTIICKVGNIKDGGTSACRHAQLENINDCPADRCNLMSYVLNHKPKFTPSIKNIKLGGEKKAKVFLCVFFNLQLCA